jgi:hypothetical protein
MAWVLLLAVVLGASPKDPGPPVALSEFPPANKKAADGLVGRRVVADGVVEAVDPGEKAGEFVATVRAVGRDGSRRGTGAAWIQAGKRSRWVKVVFVFGVGESSALGLRPGLDVAVAGKVAAVSADFVRTDDFLWGGPAGRGERCVVRLAEVRAR